MEENNTTFKKIDALINDTPNSFKNHPATQENLYQMADWLTVLKVLSTVNGLAESDIRASGKALKHPLPEEMKVLQAAIGGSVTELFI